MSFFKTIVILLFVAGCTASCAQLESVGRLFKRVDPEIALFNDARQNQLEGSHEAAYALFREHADRYPQSPRAPEVLFSLGQVCVSLERYPDARRFFQDVTARFPDAAVAVDAGVETAGSFLSEGDYRQALFYGNKILGADLSSDQMVQVYQIIGEAQTGMKNASAAYGAFLRAYNAADASDRDPLRRSLMGAARAMPLPDLRSALEALNGRPPADDILYLLGVRYLEEGDYREAKSYLDDFVDRYPRHPDADLARLLIADIPVSDLFTKNVVGCLLPLSGRYENFGQQALKGIELALSVFAAAQDASLLKMVVRDSASSAAGAVAAVRELNDLGVAAIIGPMAEAEAAAEEAQKLKLPIVTLTQKADIPAVGEWVFRNFLTPDMQVKAIVDHAVNDLKISRFAILYPEENYGTMFMNLFWDEVIASGGRVVGVESYRPDQTDFSIPIRKMAGMYYEIPDIIAAASAADDPVVAIRQDQTDMPTEEQRMPRTVDQAPETAEKRWFDGLVDTAMARESESDGEAAVKKDDKPGPIIDFEAVFIPDSPAKAGLIMPYLAYHDVTGVYLLGTNLWHSEKLIQTAGTHSQGAVFPDGFFAQSVSEHVSLFVARFEKTYGYTPGFIEAVSYDTAMMLFEILSRPDLRHRSRLRKALLDMTAYPGVTGSTRFNENGDAQKDVYLLRISGGRFREVPARR